MGKKNIIIGNHMLFFNGQNPFSFELLQIVTKIVFRPVTYRNFFYIGSKHQRCQFKNDKQLDSIGISFF
jgi:hypothetical protein